MPRWEPEARARLEEAALALFDERGFDGTTVEDIAERAGLTKRTFFRHYTDKREVLFGGGGRLPEMVGDAVRSAPATAFALDAVAHGLYVVASALDAEGPRAARRIRIVHASPDLSERQLIKFSALAEAIAEALRSRGVGDPAAILAAESGITALRVASENWATRGKKSLRRLVDDAIAQLREVAAASSPSSNAPV